MSARESVLGVLGVCWLASPTLHSCRPRGTGLAGGVCKVCKVQARAHACAEIFFTGCLMVAFFLYARTEKPYQPYTPYTARLMPLILLVFCCVGFVLGWVFLCWVWFCEGGRGDD